MAPGRRKTRAIAQIALPVGSLFAVRPFRASAAFARLEYLVTQGLNFSDPSLASFDSSHGGHDLTGFDTATGETTFPAGTYICRVERGELVETSAGLPAYRLCFTVVAPAEHFGATVWSWHMLASQHAMNRAKKELATLGLQSLDQLRAPFPAEGQEVYCECLLTFTQSEVYGLRNNVKRFTRCSAPDGEAGSVVGSAAFPTLPNPFAVSLLETPNE